MGVNSLPKTVTRQRHDCDLNPGPSAPESSTLTTLLPSHPSGGSVARGLEYSYSNITLGLAACLQLSIGSRLASKGFALNVRDLCSFLVNAIVLSCNFSLLHMVESCGFTFSCMFFSGDAVGWVAGRASGL